MKFNIISKPKAEQVVFPIGTVNHIHCAVIVPYAL